LHFLLLEDSLDFDLDLELLLELDLFFFVRGDDDDDFDDNDGVGDRGLFRTVDDIQLPFCIIERKNILSRKKKYTKCTYFS
jgi:hypothetical protein